MGKDFDDLAAELQNQIYEETRAAYGEVAFQRWLKPLYMGKMDSPDGHARVTGSCGDTMEIFLKFEGGKVYEASFLTTGCGASAVCGSFAAELALGKTPEALFEITGETILDILGGLPDEERHCAVLAANTLRESCNDYMTRKGGDHANSGPVPDHDGQYAKGGGED